jgi:hypothetical protein
MLFHITTHALHNKLPVSIYPRNWPISLKTITSSAMKIKELFSKRLCTGGVSAEKGGAKPHILEFQDWCFPII